MMMQLIEISNLISSLCFIIALKGLSSSKSPRASSIIGISGIVISLASIFNLPLFTYKISVIITIISGSILGFYIAKRISIATIPALIAGSYSFVAIAVILVSYAIILSPQNFHLGIIGTIPMGTLSAIAFSAAASAIACGGSLVTFGKLQGFIKNGPSRFLARQYICLLLAFVLAFLTYYFIKNQNILFLTLLILAAIIFGLLLAASVDNVDITAALSLFNSYSGWAIASIGFILNNSLLIITGALIGASCTRLSRTICCTRSKSLSKIIFAAFIKLTDIDASQKDSQKAVKITSAEDTAAMLAQAKSVIIVPGYGLALSRAHHAVAQLAKTLKDRGLRVRFAIHPQAGRMQGHMNFLLTEANVDYEDMKTLEEINSDFDSTDITLVIGANDITNPIMGKNKGGFGISAINVGLSKMVIFIKRSDGTGYLASENELFFQKNALMLFGDASKMVEDIIKAI